MTESLASRNREAIEHKLSHPEFLALLVDTSFTSFDFATLQRRLVDDVDLAARIKPPEGRERQVDLFFRLAKIPFRALQVTLRLAQPFAA